MGVVGKEMKNNFVNVIFSSITYFDKKKLFAGRNDEQTGKHSCLESGFEANLEYKRNISDKDDVIQESKFRWRIFLLDIHINM